MFWDFSLEGNAGSLRIESNPWLPETKGDFITITPYGQQTQPIEIPAVGDALRLI